MNKILSLVLAAIVLLHCAGCNNALKRDLGISKAAPDEFRVIAAKPLVMPPNFSLRPTINNNQNVADNSKKFTQGELKLLSNLQHMPVNPEIRQIVEEEFTAVQTDSRFLFSSPFGKKDKRGMDVLDPKAEVKQGSGV